MSVPKDIRYSLRQKLWAFADSVSWMKLGPVEKSHRYAAWTEDPAIGGVLSRFIDKGKVRLYIKDTLLKDYNRAQLQDHSRILSMLKIPSNAAVAQTYEKPHGLRFSDGREIAWGRADDWKVILLALHERAFLKRASKPYAAVLLSSGRYGDQGARAVVEDVAKRLSIGTVMWVS
jgi:hypothetical protein